jgi:MFS family permease
MMAGYAATGQNREHFPFFFDGMTLTNATCSLAANAQIGLSLHASDSEITWTMSVFIIVQGLFPLVWSAVSEIKGRKVRSQCVKQANASLRFRTIQVVYLLSMLLFTVGSAVVATSTSIGLVIGMRALQAAGWVHSCYLIFYVFFDPTVRLPQFKCRYGNCCCHSR